MTAINQKEYLKKYLGIGKVPGEKRKKKKKKETVSRITIIDDDVESSVNLIEEDLMNQNEDAPQIVAIIDERPPSLRFDDKTKDLLWKPIEPATSDSQNNQHSLITKFKINETIKDHNRQQQDVSSTSRKVTEIDDDYSPPRRSNKESESQPRSQIKKEITDSPPRNRDISPLRRPIKQEKIDDDISPPRQIKTEKVDDDYSPPRKKRSPKQSLPRRPSGREEAPIINEKTSKMKKTLDGKTAGLQNARELAKETDKFKKREEALFKNMSTQVSGENASTVLRDRKTGKVRNLEEELENQKVKEAEENKKKEKYSRWGRGLKQVEDGEKRAVEMLHEMSKPLARYADDEDLEKYLKEQERDGDPMLAYIRAKKRKKAVEQGHSEKPQYMGEFLPNRYGIRPGHRWDGVNRSNGFEIKWFTVQNEKKASLEDTYKWSSEDM